MRELQKSLLAKARVKRWRDKCIRDGRCWKCGKPPLFTSRLCLTCRDKRDLYARERREIRQRSGTCVKCGKHPPERGIQYCCECKIGQGRAKCKLRRTRKEGHLCSNCGKRRDNPTGATVLCLACLFNAKQEYQRVRDRVFEHYGKTCCCCGESERAFLSMDHINNDGAQHRRDIGESKIYGWLARNKFPSGFQTLCMNCQFGKKNCGICPHQTKGAV